MNPSEDCPEAPATATASKKAHRIIVLDDELELRNMLQRFLRSEGYDVRALTDSEHLYRALEREPFDLLVLDLMMPGENGLSVCRRLRAEGQTIPILMLTARGDPVDRVVGLENGADNYLAKPFLQRELAARIRAMLRRQQILLDGAPSPPERLRFGGFTLALRHHALRRGDERVDLKSAELLLLKALATTPNRAVSRHNLTVRARGRGYEANVRSIDVQIQQLRQAIETVPAEPHHIKTLWGLGYVLGAEVIA